MDTTNFLVATKRPYTNKKFLWTKKSRISPPSRLSMRGFPFLSILCHLNDVAASREAGSSTMMQRSSSCFVPTSSLYQLSPLRTLFSSHCDCEAATTKTILPKAQQPFSTMTTSLQSQRSVIEPEKPLRIAIVGGGIAGVTVAHGLAKRFRQQSEQQADGSSPCRNGEIFVFEADNNGGPQRQQGEEQRPPQWLAATARNANSMVPAVSNHIFSNRETLWKLIQDTVEEWYLTKLEHFDRFRDDVLQSITKTTKPVKLRKLENFEEPPPYFALDLINCLGPSATSDERATFVRFAYHFVKAALFLGEEKANQRSQHMVQLAKANHVGYLQTIDQIKSDEEKSAFLLQLGHSTGFMSLHRTLDQAKFAVKECQEWGHEATLLDWELATDLEPRLKNIPIKPLFAVHRPNDITSSCEGFVRHLIRESTKMDVKYIQGKQGSVDKIEVKNNNDNNTKDSVSSANSKAPSFIVKTADGVDHDPFDIVVLAAGCRTPLFATQLGIGKFCPTYPMRGYSLTLHVNDHHSNDSGAEDSVKDKPERKQRQNKNLLNQAFSVDSMYCSSVSPYMARLAGFGEFVGYRNQKTDKIKSVAPAILARYGSIAFPDAQGVRLKEVNHNNTNATFVAKPVNDGDTKVNIEAQACFRPCSPDDIPIVGETSALPGVFIHTGHGTFGWTLGISTAECTTQAVWDKVQASEIRDGKNDNGNDIDKANHKEQSVFILPDNTTIDRKILSPNRFA